MSYRDDLEAAHARIAALEAVIAGNHEDAERTRLVDELAAAHLATAQVRAELARELETARRAADQARAELAQVRAECARHVERIRILHDERDRRRAAPSSKPAILERGARPVCPACLAGGHEVRLIPDRQLTPSICPHCAGVTLLRA